MCIERDDDMNALSRMKLSRQLALGYGVVILLMVLMAGLTFRQLLKVQADSHVLLSEQAERLALAQEWRENILVNSQRALAIGVTADERLAAFFKDVVTATTVRTSEIQKRYVEMETSPEGRQLQDRLGEARKRYLAERDAVMKAQGDADARLAAGEKFRDVTNAYIAEATEMVKFQQARSASLGQQIDAELVTARNTLWGVTAVCALLAAALGWSQARSIRAPLARLQDAARSIAQGDLSREVPTMAGDSEAAQLMHDVAQMQAALRQLVSQARQATDSIEVASREVAAGNTDLSARTEQAASSLEESASSMEELTGTVKHTAEAAQTANRLADGAEAVAQQGGAVMQQVVATMDGIHQASQKIADIIGVIDGIAFQTNILALNAAVEAARAGEQGRGFAVVAGEVRTLAQRSAQAAKEIKGLIGDSVAKVEAGSALAANAGKTMGDIVGQVQRVTDLIAEISAASAEQSQGIDQIGDAVTQLDQVTQQNAALVEQSAAAAESLKQQAAKMSEAVAVFRLG